MRFGPLRPTAAYAVWPKGRIVAVEAKDVGEFATVAVLPPGRTLRINALTKRAGGIQVEIARPVDEPKVRPNQPYEEVIPGRSFADCDTVLGDQHWSTVTWNGEKELGCRDDEAVILRFHMDRAQLFGVEFK
jgi:hypothetical protein